MELKLERTKLKIDLYGEIVEIKKPTYGEVEWLESEIKEASGDEEKAKTIVKKFFVTLGLDPSNIEVDHLFQILELITGKKKA